jgi:DNA-binding transcriptional ArsR family regulator
LRAVGELLLDIHGQHAWQSLTRAAAVRELLDAYARVSTAALSGHWQRWQEARRQHAEALAAQSNLQDRRDKLLWQIGEVDKLQPQPDEWDSLNTEHARLSNGQALLDAAQGALDALDGDDGGALRRLAAACAAVEPQQDIESRFAEPVQMLNAALAQTEETVRSLRAYLLSGDHLLEALTLVPFVVDLVEEEHWRGSGAREEPLSSFLRIFRVLIGAATQGMTPGELSVTLDVPGSTLSFHLKELMHAGLVTQERDGRNLIYRPSIEQMNDLLAYLTAHCCQGDACEIVSSPGCTTC